MKIEILRYRKWDQSNGAYVEPSGNFSNTAALEKGVVTPAGKAQLTVRVAEQKAFYDALARETDGFKNL